jgi:hypothetical protein
MLGTNEIMPSFPFFSFLLVLSFCVASVNNNMFVVADQVRQNEELAKAFDLQFVCLREKELAKQQRLENIGLIGVYNEDSANLIASYDQMGKDAHAYLQTLTPPSD